MYYKKHKSTVKAFTNFSALGIKDLEKIKAYYYQNLDARQKREFELIDIENKNKELKIKYEEYKHKNIKPIADYLKKAKIFLEQNKVNYLSLSNLMGTAVRWQKDYYRNTKQVTDVISEIERQQVLMRQYEKENLFKYCITPWKIENTLPSLEKKLFKFGGISHYVFFDLINIDFIKLCIKKILDKESEKIKTIDELKARGASNESETRKIAESFKRKYPLNRQLSTLRDCPYCSRLLEKNNAHLEHIYPVSKGGKSGSKNLVWICSSCNLKKNNKTLSSFIKIHGMDRETIEAHLDFLEKEY